MPGTRAAVRLGLCFNVPSCIGRLPIREAGFVGKKLEMKSLHHPLPPSWAVTTSGTALGRRSFAVTAPEYDASKDAESSSDLSRLARQASVSLGGSFAGRLLNFLTYALLARMLGPASLGLYAIGTALLQVLEGVARLGMSNGVIRLGTNTAAPPRRSETGPRRGGHADRGQRFADRLCSVGARPVDCIRNLRKRVTNSCHPMVRRCRTAARHAPPRCSRDLRHSSNAVLGLGERNWLLESGTSAAGHFLAGWIRSCRCDCGASAVCWGGAGDRVAPAAAAISGRCFGSPLRSPNGPATAVVFRSNRGRIDPGAVFFFPWTAC